MGRILNRVSRIDLTDKVTCRERYEETEGQNHGVNLGKVLLNKMGSHYRF